MRKKTQKAPHKPAFLSGDSSDFVFNHSIFPEDPSQSHTKKRKASKPAHSSSDFPRKKTKKQSSSTLTNDPFVDEDQYMAALQEKDTNPFLLLEGKGSLLPKNRLPAVKYPIGTLVLAAINEKGPNGLYMTVNLSRNKKAFISKEDCPVNLDVFILGEYVLGKVIHGKNPGQKTQLTLRPDSINEERNEFCENMVITACFLSKEDHGWTFSINDQGGRAFIQKNNENKDKFNDLVKDKPYLLRIIKKNKKSKILICCFAYIEKETYEDLNDFSNFALAKNKQEDLEIKQYLTPGTLISAKIIKLLENGLIIRLFSKFHGFIFDEHLMKPLQEYAISKKIFARIIYFDPDSQRLLLSCKENVLFLETFPMFPKYLGEIFSDFSIFKKALGGGHLFLRRESEPDVQLFISKKQIDQDIFSEKKTANLKAKIKAFNYLEGIYIGTMQEEFMKEKTLSWLEIKTGDFLSCTIDKIKEERVIVSCGKGIKGVIDSLNLSDKPLKSQFKTKFKENKSIRARVLSIDPLNKRLFLTTKPIFMQESAEIIKDISNVSPGDSFYGYVSGQNNFGFIISFFNNLKGLLTFKHLEEFDKRGLDSLPLGKTIKVYIIFVNKEKKKLGLSLSKPENLLLNQSQRVISYENTFESFINKKPDFFLENNEVNLGQVHEYRLVKSPSFFPNEDFLLLQSLKDKKLNHKAIVHKDHISDLLGSKLFDLFKENPQLTKEKPIKGLIIGKIANSGCYIVSLKKSLLLQYQNYRTFPYSFKDLTTKTSYYTYIKRVLEKGLIVSFHENLQGFLPYSKIDNPKSGVFPQNKSMKIFISKINEENKILCSALSKQICEKDHQKEFSPLQGYLDEESLHLRTIKSPFFDKINIGDFIRGEITHLKEYGIIVKLLDYENLMGFIIIDNLIDQKDVYHKGYMLQARVLDIDYEKGIVDLKEIRTNNENKFGKLLGKSLFNIQKIIKFHDLFKKNAVFHDAKVLLVKESYVIIALKETKETVYGLLETKNVNENRPAHELFTINSTIKGICLQNFNEISKLNTQNFDHFHKMSFLPIFCVINEEKAQKNLERKMSIEESLADLKRGQKIQGKIIKIQRNSLILQIISPTKSGLGRLHFSQIPYDSVSHKSQVHSYTLSQKLSCKILSLPIKSEKKTLFFELTSLPCHMELEDQLLNESSLLPTMNELSTMLEKKDPSLQQRFFPAMIKSIATNSISPLYFELSPHIFGSVYSFGELVLPQQFEILNNINEYFHEKDIYEVRILSTIHKTDENSKVFSSLQLSLLPYKSDANNKNSISEGDLLIVKIIKALHNGLRVQYSPTGFASVDLIEISDEFSDKPLERFPIGHYTPARVLSVKENIINLSLRETLINERSWNILMSEGTMAYKQAFEEIEGQGDLRNRVLKLGQNSLKEGMLFLGYVHQTNSNGCFIKIAKDVVARAKLNELCENITEEKTRLEVLFCKNRLVIGRILAILPDNKIEVSLRESVVKYGFPLNLDTLKPSMKIQGQVVGYRGEQAIIRIKGSKLQGSLALKDSNQSHFDNINKAFPLGSLIVAKVLSIQKEDKVRIRLGNQDGFLEDCEEVLMPEVEKDSILFDSIQKIFQEEELEEVIPEEQELISKSKIKSQSSIEESDKSEDLLEEEEEEKDEENIESSPNSEESSSSEELEQEENSVSKQQNPEENQMEIEEIPQKKRSKKQKQRDFIEKELEIREKEKALLAGSEHQPQNSDDFERLLLQNPSNSYYWINYIAFTLEQKGIEEARTIAERATKAINFSSENEKLNIWTAYMNMENSFGSEKTLVNIFDRALMVNNPKKVYFKLLEIYRRNDQQELSVELAKKMIKKHKNSCKAWLQYMQNLISAEKKGKIQSFDSKETVKRALQSLEKRKHLKFLSHCARLDFMFGDVEKGRTTFEAIVTNYPKRFFF